MYILFISIMKQIFKKSYSWILGIVYWLEKSFIFNYIER